MSDLIWVGNTLLPRGTVILAAVMIVLAIVVAVTVVRELVESPKQQTGNENV